MFGEEEGEASVGVEGGLILWKRCGGLRAWEGIRLDPPTELVGSSTALLTR